MKEFQFPIIKICLFFVLGITIYPYIELSFMEMASASIAILILLSIIVYKRLSPKISTFCIICLAILSGSSASSIHDERKNKNHYLQNKDSQENNEIVVELKEKLKSTPSNNRYEAEVLAINKTKSEGKVIVSIKKHPTLPNFEYGTRVRFLTKIRLLNSSNNPDEFDYKKYLENKSIYGQIFVSINDISYAHPSSFSLKTIASRIRNSIIKKLEKNHFNKEELNVFAALILGQQQDISKEIIQDYQYAGAIHILSVSGLHVGLLLGFLTLLLSPLANTKRNAILKLVIILISLMFFGILAGLSPSVLRSVTMFSFVTIGLFLRRSINFYNTLLVSAFILLLFEPSYLYDVGFQLSYLALFFIVWLQPLISSLYQPKNKIIKYLWDIITVSTAAQIGTLPISLYYFHQFSGLFFITNCMILPLLSIVMGIGIIVLIMASINCFWIPMLKLMEFCIWIINTIIHKIAAFEQFIIKDIPFTYWTMIGLYLIIITWTMLFKKPNFSKTVIALLSVIFFQIIIIYKTKITENMAEFVIFSKNRSSLFIEKKGQRVTVISNENETNNSSIKAYTTAHLSKVTDEKKIQNVYYINSKKIIVIDSTCVYLPKSKPDIIVLIQSPKINLETILSLHKPKQIIADASNYKSYIWLWKETCKKENIPFHAVAEKGYFVIK